MDRPCDNIHGFSAFAAKRTNLVGLCRLGVLPALTVLSIAPAFLNIYRISEASRFAPLTHEEDDNKIKNDKTSTC